MFPIKKQLSLFFFSVFVFAFGSLVRADTSQDIGQYIVHYNTVATTFLNRKVAQAYNIKRSKNKAMITVAMIKKVPGTTGIAVEGMVSAYSTNLNNQLRQIKLRKISEDGGKAIYYIGEFKVNNNETLNFTLSVSPENKKPPVTIKFQKHFFVD